MSVTYIKLFFSYRTDLSALNSSEIGNLLMGALDYAENHTEPIFSGNEKIIWPMIRGQIDRDQKSYEAISQKRKEAINARYKKDASSNENKSIQMNTNVDKTKTKKKDKEEDKDNSFIEFWKAYPKKQGKGYAEKAWREMKPPLDQVLEALDRQKRSTDWRKDNGQYIPYPAKWLKGKYWENEVSQGPDYGQGEISF